MCKESFSVVFSFYFFLFVPDYRFNEVLNLDFSTISYLEHTYETFYFIDKLRMEETKKKKKDLSALNGCY